ncbi:hypothetical protein ACH4SP_05440 [Streptomyces sp. NPDC021093]|uniref:hypothetical protein n=1 Tax=Streptomyces sp. NPDC021093 TaxID=3365112 RepID=UPI0037A03C90
MGVTSKAGRAGARRGRHVGAVAVAMSAITALLVGASACDPGQEALDRTEMCVKIVKITLFNPFPEDAAKAKRDVQERAEELDRLTASAPDEKLRKAIESTADSLRTAEPKDSGARTVVGYLTEQNERLKELRNTCLNANDF